MICCCSRKYYFLRIGQKLLENNLSTITKAQSKSSQNYGEYFYFLVAVVIIQILNKMAKTVTFQNQVGYNKTSTMFFTII